MGGQEEQREKNTSIIGDKEESEGEDPQIDVGIGRN